MRFNSIRFKITILYAGILGLILTVYSGVLYFTLQFALYQELDAGLNEKVGGITTIINSYIDVLGQDDDSFLFAVKRAIQQEGEHPEEEKIRTLEYQWLQRIDKFDLTRDFINFLSCDGSFMVSSKNLSFERASLLSQEVGELGPAAVLFKNIRLEERDVRVIEKIVSIRGRGKYIIQIGASLKPLIGILKNRSYYILLSIPLVLLLTSFVGRMFASRILKPVLDITETAQSISHEDLTARVETEHIDEEMKRLVDAFNDMIMRLSRSFTYIAEFSSQVAHELKTPLAIIRGESEMALRQGRSADEYKDVIQGSLEETERMLKIIEDLLLLTKLDYRPEVFSFERFDFTAFFTEICEQSAILVKEKKIVLHCDIHQRRVFIKGDSLHLRRLFFNLIHNAVKFTPAGGTIELILKCEGKKAVVSVKDTGVGIAQKDLPKIFNRFFHKDDPKQSGEPGNGLGLSIAQSIASVHRGFIFVRSRVGEGTTFTVILPLAM